MEDEHGTTEAAAMAHVFERLSRAEYARVTTNGNSPTEGAHFIVLPEGRRLQSLAPLVANLPTQPRAHLGVTVLDDLVSFVQHVERFKRDDSAIYCAGTYPATPTFTCVYDHAGGNAPSFQQHLARFAMTYAPEFLVWHKGAGSWMKQGEFARFIEARALELVDGNGDPTLADLASRLETSIGRPADMLRMARQLSVKVDATVHEAVTTATGEVSVTFQEKHEAAQAGVPLKVPTLFAVQIPVFYRGPSYTVPARLAYRVNGGRIEWQYELYRPDALVQHIAAQNALVIAQDTELPVWFGAARV
jgi:uncharacterized protein YfdQ (DUF2303 family)